MGSAKEANEYAAAPADAGDQPPPAYEVGAPGPSSSAAGPSTTPAPLATAESPAELPAEKPRGSAGPTVDAPFNFPAEGHPPAYSPSGSKGPLPIALPQASPDAASPFLPLYPPVLLTYGIPPASWASFLDTLSAFLTAKVSDRAISHAADMGRRFSEKPKSAFKHVTSHAKDVGKNIGNNAKRGNIIGAAMGTIGGVISIPISAAMGITSTALALPGSTVMAVSKKPQTPRERAVAYLAVANKDWFQSRGLEAYLMDSNQLSQTLGVSVLDVVNAAQDQNDQSVERQLGSLSEHIESLEVAGPCMLTLGGTTLWLVLVRKQTENA